MGFIKAVASNVIQESLCRKARVNSQRSTSFALAIQRGSVHINLLSKERVLRNATLTVYMEFIIKSRNLTFKHIERYLFVCVCACILFK